MSNTASVQSLAQRPAAAADQNIIVDMFSAAGFALVQRIAQAYMTSNAVPAAFRAYTTKRERKGNSYVDVEVPNPAAMGNCIVAIETAMSVRMSIAAVMQNANVIEGRLTWSGKFVIAAINLSGRFTPLRFRKENKGMIRAKYKIKGAWNNAHNGFDFTEHEVEVENLVYTAYAYAIENGKRTEDLIEGPPVSMKMVVEEGWYSKPGSKWQGDMKILMFQYRAGSFFGNINASDIMMGMGGQTTEEAEDILDIVPQPDGTYGVNVADLGPKKADVAKDAERERARAGAETVEPNMQAGKATDAAPPVEAQAAETTKSVDDAAPAVTRAADLAKAQAKTSTATQRFADGPTDGDFLEDALKAIKRGEINVAMDLKDGLPDSMQRTISDAIDDYKMALSQAEAVSPAARPAHRRQQRSFDIGG